MYSFVNTCTEIQLCGVKGGSLEYESMSYNTEFRTLEISQLSGILQEGCKIFAKFLKFQMFSRYLFSAPTATGLGNIYLANILRISSIDILAISF